MTIKTSGSSSDLGLFSGMTGSEFCRERNSNCGSVSVEEPQPRSARPSSRATNGVRCPLWPQTREQGGTTACRTRARATTAIVPCHRYQRTVLKSECEGCLRLSRGAPMRLLPFSYFCTCWNETPRRLASCACDMPLAMRQMRTLRPTATSMALGLLGRLLAGIETAALLPNVVQDIYV
jgi:hypothetical protein